MESTPGDFPFFKRSIVAFTSVIVGSNVYAPRKFLLKLRPSVTRVKSKVEKSKVKREHRENEQNAMNRRIRVDGL